MNRTLITALAVTLLGAAGAQDRPTQAPSAQTPPRSVLNPAPKWVDERPVAAWAPVIEIKTLEILTVTGQSPSRRWREAIRHYREHKGVREGAQSKRRAEVSEKAKARSWGGKNAISALQEIITDAEDKPTSEAKTAQAEQITKMSAGTVVQWRARYERELRRIMTGVRARTGTGDETQTPRGEPRRRNAGRTEVAQ